VVAEFVRREAAPPVGGLSVSEDKSRVNRVFYGWNVVAALFFEMAFTIGVGLFTFSVFLLPILRSFPHWDRADVSLAYSLELISYGIAAPLLGKLVDSVGGRRVLLVAIVGTAATFYSLAHADGLLEFYALYAVLGVCMCSTGYIPVTGLLAHWFSRKRGKAIGFALAGVGFGTLTMSVVLGRAIEAYGWRAAYELAGGCLLIMVLPVTYLVLRDDPAVMGLTVDGITAPAGTREGDTAAGTSGGRGFSSSPLKTLSLWESTRTFGFWLLSIAAALHTLTFTGILAHIVPMLIESHYSVTVAGLALGVSVGTSALGRIGGGTIADWTSEKYALAGSVAIQSLGVAFALALGKSMLFVILFVGLFGFGFGGAEATIPVVLAEFFGLRAFGQVYGVLTLLATLGGFVGPVLAGRIYDASGSYEYAVIVFVISSVLAVAFVVLARQPVAAALMSGDGSEHNDRLSAGVWGGRGEVEEPRPGDLEV
jgi:MFS family permease